MAKLGSPTSRTMIKLIFYAHMVVGTLSYIAVFLLISGAINLLVSSEGLSFWTRGMLYGLLFFSSMYGVNHVTNDDGFCVLTNLENFYRTKEGLPRVGRFMPRYSAAWRSLWKRIRRSLKKTAT